MNLRSRLEKLEGGKGTGLVVVFPTETIEQAEKRWRGEHPGQDPDRVLQVVLVDPPRRPPEDYEE